jgi:hypothetical protein
MSVNEDELASTFIKFFKQQTKNMNEDSCGCVKIDTFPEASYNHYGNRGFVDLYIRRNHSGTFTEGYVYELKSESAVREATGANEIVRQFNKMREYFFKGSSKNIPEEVNFELCFTPTHYNINHIYNNIEIYSSIAKEKLHQEMVDSEISLVTTRPANKEDFTPIIFASPNNPPISNFNFKEYVKSNNETVYEKNRELIKNISKEYADSGNS